MQRLITDSHTVKHLVSCLSALVPRCIRQGLEAHRSFQLGLNDFSNPAGQRQHPLGHFLTQASAATTGSEQRMGQDVFEGNAMLTEPAGKHRPSIGQTLGSFTGYDLGVRSWDNSPRQDFVLG